MRAVAPSSVLLAFLAPLASQEPRPLPSLEAATRIHDTRAAADRTWPELVEALAQVDVVFLGETHVDDTTHQVELRVLQEMLHRRQGRVVLAMEMFERDVQPVLDD
ncbi:MAG: ChaN family lipoprotein, partial [Planctomycetes bacterium]|nr:ChaN family lipoprotein [Planctomycetota bacterium]